MACRALQGPQDTPMRLETAIGGEKVGELLARQEFRLPDREESRAWAMPFGLIFPTSENRRGLFRRTVRAACQASAQAGHPDLSIAWQIDFT
jgi:hypothetical protein